MSDIYHGGECPSYSCGGSFGRGNPGTGFRNLRIETGGLPQRYREDGFESVYHVSGVDKRNTEAGVFYGNTLYFIEDVWVGYAHHGAYSALACFGFKVWEVLTVQLVHLPYLLFQCHLSEECLDTLFCLLIRFVISGITDVRMK